MVSKQILFKLFIFFLLFFFSGQKSGHSARSNRHLNVSVLLRLHSELSSIDFLKVAKLNFGPSNSYWWLCTNK